MSAKLPSDQDRRERFVREIDRSFSVIAPAGVGKTRAIVDRIVTLATSDPAIARDRLPKLVVVTYTKKSAEEMYQRARNAIIEKRVDLAVLSTFNQAFFGTIHSFCVRLLKQHGHLLGLPAQFEAVDDDDALWTAFVRQLDRIAPKVDADIRTACLRLVPAKDIFAVARKVRSEHLIGGTIDPGKPPEISIQWVMEQEVTEKNKNTVGRSQEDLQVWHTLWTKTQRYAPLPKCLSTAKGFKESWNSALGPIQRWCASAIWALAREVAEEYRAFRLAQGQLTFEDQIDLAFALTQNAEAVAAIRHEGYSVLLDEAQDTDPTQFNILLEIARPEDATGLWILNGGKPPVPGRFCMVGDPQQSIYSARADLAQYQRIREMLVKSHAADELTFDVTFRCDQAIIDAANALAQPLLNGEGGQADYSVLRPRPDVEPGCVIKWTPPEPPTEDVKRVEDVSLLEMDQLADWLAKTGYSALGASSWSEVAILCPRTRWLQTAAFALKNRGLAAQIHSERSVLGDSPVYAWFTALMTVIADPGDHFELVGVLREIYGISDEALAARVEGTDPAWVADPSKSDEITLALRNIEEIVARTKTEALRDVVQNAVRLSQLRERLLSLPLEARSVNEELDALIARAARAEADGSSLSDFVTTLRDAFENVVAGRPVQEDAVQLFTCFKAKGLQWDVVILPMMYRQISFVSSYPDILRKGPTEPPRVIFAKADMDELGPVAELKRRQELERLLYVGLTRAKRTMIFVDDEEFYRRKKRNLSFIDILQMMDEGGKVVYRKAWQELTDTLPKTAKPRAAAMSAEPVELRINVVESATWTAAKEITESGMHRVLPYQLAEKQDSEVRVDEPPGAETAKAYGIWWHEMMESQDWRAPRTEWNSIFEAHVQHAPLPERARTEWKLFLKSDLADRLETLAKTGHAHPEMPILLKRTDTECIEGIIDLALFDADGKSCFLLDWKTNQVTPNNATSLRDLYAPQLTAYSETLSGITKTKVESGLYSTATGLWIPCP